MPIARTALNKLLQGSAQLCQISQPFVDLGEMTRGDLAHVGAAAARVFVQHQEVAAVLQRKVEPSRTAQEAQPVDISGAEMAIAVLPALRGHKTDVLIVSDRLGGETRRPRGFGDVHSSPPLP